MRNEEISAIAREYAEETAKGSDTVPRKLLVNIKARTMKKYLYWLLHHYYLVPRVISPNQLNIRRGRTFQTRRQYKRRK